MPCFTQLLNFSAMLVSGITCLHPSSIIHDWFYQWLMSDWDLKDWRWSFPLWPVYMMDPMLFCVSTLSCATKLVEALILLGQENPLVSVAELRWVGFWSLDLSGQFPPMFSHGCGYSPLVALRVSAKSWSNMSTIITCIMSYMLYNMKCKARKWNYKQFL